MESTAHLKPRLTIIVPAMLGYSTVLAALDAWEAQSCRERFEILVLCPAEPRDAVVPAGQRILATGAMELHRARAAAIRQATSEYIMLAEDHCLPDAQWAEVVSAGMEQGWDGIAPSLRSGRPTTACAQASFLLGYGEWMNPVSSGPVAVLPGHNVVLRRQPLLELGAELEEELLVAAFLMRRLGRDGSRFFLDSGVKMRHFDSPSFARELNIFFRVGLGFGAMRTRRWSWIGRGLYWLAAPVIAAMHLRRGFRQYRRAGAQAGFRPACLLASSMLAMAWAAGEAIGAVVGVARAASVVQYSEIKPVKRGDV